MSAFISIITASNRPQNLLGLFENFDQTLENPSSCELLIKIDDDDQAMIDLLSQEKSKHKFAIKYEVAPKEEGYWSLWKYYNQLLHQASPETYFVMGINDEVRFSTQGWDRVLESKKNLFPDHLYHLRLSPRKHIKFKSLIECILSGESFAFFTKKWVDLTEGWAVGPAGGDSGQECVNFFLREKFHHDRGIPISEIEFKDAEDSISASHGLSHESWRKKLHHIHQMYSKILSWKYCENKYLRSAQKIALAIESQKNDVSPHHFDDTPQTQTLIFNGKEYSYCLPLEEWLNHFFDIQPLGPISFDLHRWPPILANLMIARRLIAEELLITPNNDIPVKLVAPFGQAFIKILSSDLRSHPLTPIEHDQIDSTVDEIFQSDHNLPPEKEFLRELISTFWIYNTHNSTQRKLALLLYYMNEEVEKDPYIKEVLSSFTS